MITVKKFLGWLSTTQGNVLLNTDIPNHPHSFDAVFAELFNLDMAQSK